jgi:hypothetical protein
MDKKTRIQTLNNSFPMDEYLELSIEIAVRRTYIIALELNDFD